MQSSIKDYTLVDLRDPLEIVSHEDLNILPPVVLYMIMKNGKLEQRWLEQVIAWIAPGSF